MEAEAALWGERQFGRGKRHVSNYPGPYGPTRIKNESVICHTNTGWGNGGGASRLPFATRGRPDAYDTMNDLCS